MGDLARCPNPECQIVLDIPGMEHTYRQIDGQCATCHQKNPGPPMDLPPEVIQAVKGREPPLREMKLSGTAVEQKESRVHRKSTVPNTQSPPPPDTAKFAVESSAIGPDSPYQVEAGVPLDYDDRPVYRGKYPFPQMKPPRKGPTGQTVYDSFCVPYEGRDPDGLRGALYQAVKQYRDHYAPGFKTKMKALREGIRIWRVEDKL